MGFTYSVSLQVWHPDVPPEAIERSLALTARHRATAGQERRAADGSPLPGTYRETYCGFDLANGEDGKLALCLKSLVAELNPKRGSIEEIKRSGGRLNFFVGWTCGEHGEVFDSELLSEIANLGIDLGIEPFRVEQHRSSS